MNKHKLFYFLTFLLIVFLVTGCTNIGQNFQSNQNGDGSIVSGNNMLNNPNFIGNNMQIDVKNITSYQDLIATCKPAVVGISATNGRYQSIGSGVCVDNTNHILTNYHVVEDGNVIGLYLSDGSTANATLVWTDASSDLAILKASKQIPYLPLASNNSYKSGDEVVAIGTPLDLAFKHSATKGIISAVNRTISVDNDFGESTLYNLIQHDASINPGNSGGPLINMSGEVVGINTVKVTDAEGMGFAIPVDTFKPVIQKVNANGSYTTTYIGVFGYDYQLKKIGKLEHGFYVQSVAKNSPAEKAGINSGDIITKIDDVDIDLARELKTKLYTHNVGDVVKISVKSKDDMLEKTYEIKLEKHPCSYTMPKKITN